MLPLGLASKLDFQPLTNKAVLVAMGYLSVFIESLVFHVLLRDFLQYSFKVTSYVELEYNILRLHKRRKRLQQCLRAQSHWP
jgi:hypothetical protein